MEARRLGNALFLEDFADISRPLEAVRGRFIGGGRWFAPFLSAAE